MTEVTRKDRIMNDKSKRIRQAFCTPFQVPAKVTPQGFEIDGHILPELLGRVRRVSLARKLFEDAILSCQSQDGVYGSGGKICDLCRHPQCQPRLRLQLDSGHVIHLLELPPSSAKNLFAIEDTAARQKVHLWDWALRLTVEDRGHWGEVRFERAPLQSPDVKTSNVSAPLNQLPDIHHPT